MNNTQRKNTQGFAQPCKKGKGNQATHEANARSLPIGSASNMEDGIVIGAIRITNEHGGNGVAIFADHTTLMHSCYADVLRVALADLPRKQCHDHPMLTSGRIYKE
jgi:hypothetical protein